MLDSIFRVVFTCFFLSGVLAVSVSFKFPKVNQDYLKRTGYTPELNPCTIGNLGRDVIKSREYYCK